MKRFFQFFFLFLFIFTGCSSKNTAKPAEPETEALEHVSVMNQEPPDKPKPVSVYIKEAGYTPSLYEPEEGCYLGVKLTDKGTTDIDIAKFEELTKTEHCFYLYEMNLGDIFPIKWLLSCLSEMKTPYIIINAPNNYSPFDTGYLETAAKEFGEFYVPIFLDFYPNPQQKNYNSEDYIEFYQEAREIFRDNASNVAFVYSVESRNTNSSRLYYPGDDYVDWVGISIYEKINAEEQVYTNDIFKNIDFIFYSFQKSKPLLISQYAVSHYSGMNNRYYTKEAAERLADFYKKIASEYPRIKAVNYVDINEISSLNDKENADNYSITEDESLIDAYVNSVSSDRFLSELKGMYAEDSKEEIFKSPFLGCRILNDYYVSEKTLKYDLNISDTAGLRKYKKIILGEPYYHIASLESSNAYRIDTKNGDIAISR